MKENFAFCLKHILKFEGGYADHPLDPGGATNLGITKRTLERHRGRALGKADVRALTVKEAAAIYRRNYWDAAACDRLPAGIDLAVFDCAVNQGPGRAAKYLQQAARSPVGGAIGERTLAAVKAAGAQAVLIEFMALRMRHYGLLRRMFPTFGLGWSRRLMATMASAVAMQRARQTAAASKNSASPQQKEP